MTFRLLFVGDVVGPRGCAAVVDLVPELRGELGLDAVVVNAENSAPTGRGITPESGAALLGVADFLTLGNHSFDAEGHEGFLEGEGRVIRPANFNGRLPGRGWGTFEAGGVTVGVVNVLGKVFIDKTEASAFRAADGAIEELEGCGADVVLVDAHAEATGEKEALGYHLAGRAQAVLGTHTHVPTADARVLPGGTAYLSDVGMTGCRESVIGFDRDDFLGLFVQNGRPRRGIHVETKGPVTFNAALVEFDVRAREAVRIEPIRRVVADAPPRESGVGNRESR